MAAPRRYCGLFNFSDQQLHLSLPRRLSAGPTNPPHGPPHIQAAQLPVCKVLDKDNPSTITDLLLQYALKEDIKDAAVRVVHLNMLCAKSHEHGSGIFTTHALFELARMPANQIENIRAGIIAAIDSEGGVTNKAVVGKFHVLNSLLKEIERFHLLFASVFYLTILPTLELTWAKQSAPRGGLWGKLSLRMGQSCMRGVSSPSRPSRCTTIRMSTTIRSSLTPSGSHLRKGEKDNAAHDIQQSFTHLKKKKNVFGLEKYGCPGRFFPALKIKGVLAELLLSYDIAFPEGASRTPKPLSFNIFTVPNPTAQLIFTNRKVSI
ncbi:hypothetical protein B0H17DRAFT_1149938 [Mycena rosella]|uniref:Cytochrome P450 n=1 Tax=Mycena rosella TaxID=1033263 RepID=A0AAD7BXX7_MYCRO|nr:hypothetical protein B0H17DRAFT_1149938 [Mycena rosella]